MLFLRIPCDELLNIIESASSCSTECVQEQNQQFNEFFEFSGDTQLTTLLDS